MEEINRFVGERIRFFRRLQGLTLQQLADVIGKSKATVSKYEKSEIALDVEVLFDIASVLGVNIGQLTDFPLPFNRKNNSRGGRSNFAQADTLFLYTYDARTPRVTEGVIQIQEVEGEAKATMFFDVPPSATDYHDCRSYYQGKVDYHTGLICFLLNNQFNSAENVLLYLYNPIDLEEDTLGMLSGLSRQNMQPIAMRVLVCLHRHKLDDTLKERLLLPKQTHREVKKLNLFTVGNEWNSIT